MKPFSKCLIPKCNQSYHILLQFGDYKGLKILREKNHLMARKRFLGVHQVKWFYVDLGRFPLYIISYLRLLEMETDRLPKKAYEMQLCLDENGRDCWASRMREILCETDFSFEWPQQGVGDVIFF